VQRNAKSIARELAGVYGKLVARFAKVVVRSHFRHEVSSGQSLALIQPRSSVVTNAQE